MQLQTMLCWSTYLRGCPMGAVLFWLTSAVWGHLPAGPMCHGRILLKDRCSALTPTQVSCCLSMSPLV